VRAAAALSEGVSEAFGGRNIRLFALITNTLAKDKEIEDKLAPLPAPDLLAQPANMVEDEVVDALVAAVRESFPRLSHRYYAMKAKWLGLAQLQHWDRNAPLPEVPDAEHRLARGARRVLSTPMRAFSPELAASARRFFDKPWIDAACGRARRRAPSRIPTVPSAHPYLLLNYHGKARDVMTLAHELGHGVHQVLAAKQGYLQADTPLTLAETASVFGEMLTFRALLDAQRRSRAAQARAARRQGRGHAEHGGAPDRLLPLRDAAARRAPRGRADARAHRRDLDAGADARASARPSTSRRLPDYWAYIPHFIHSPFYVYAYAFGDCLVNALYACLREGASDGFAAAYLDMLRAGGTKRHKELLAPFGLDASDPAFWDKGLDVIAGFIDELERSVDRMSDRERREHAGRRGRPLCPHLGAGRRAAARASPASASSASSSDKHAMPSLKRRTRRAQGPADEGGAVPLDRPGRAARGIRAGTRHAAVQRAADGLGLRAPAHAERARPRLAVALRELRAGGRGGRLARPGASRDAADGSRGRLQAAISRHADSAVEADLRQLKIAFAIYRRYDRAIDRRHPQGDLGPAARGARLRARGAHMRLYAHMLRKEPRRARAGADPRAVDQAAADDDLARRPPLLTARDAPGRDAQPHRAHVPRLVRAVLRYGVIHGDPHLGNYSIRDDGDVNLLDFGAIRVFPPAFVGGVIDLYRALRDGDEALALHAYESWGFKDLSKESIQVLNRWAAFIYAPLMEDRPRLIQETNSGSYGREVAEKVHAELRRIGGVRPPREFVLMDRAAIGSARCSCTSRPRSTGTSCSTP
jgi:hypothetical protein